MEGENIYINCERRNGFNLWKEQLRICINCEWGNGEGGCTIPYCPVKDGTMLPEE